MHENPGTLIKIKISGCLSHQVWYYRSPHQNALEEAVVNFQVSTASQASTRSWVAFASLRQTPIHTISPQIGGSLWVVTFTSPGRFTSPPVLLKNLVHLSSCVVVNFQAFALGPPARTMAWGHGLQLRAVRRKLQSGSWSLASSLGKYWTTFFWKGTLVSWLQNPSYLLIYRFCSHLKKKELIARG